MDRWFEVEEGKATSVGGVCVLCMNAVPAGDLRYRIGPFGKWEGWVCGTCDKEPRRPRPLAARKKRPKY